MLSVVTVLSVAAVRAADLSGGYRLAGVIATGEKRVGFLELPQGGQVLIGLGSTVNGGQVVEFSAQRLRIAFPDRTIELTLTGAAAAPLAAPVAAPPAGPVVAKSVPVASHHPKRLVAESKPIVMPAFTPSEATLRQFREKGPPPLPAEVDPTRYVSDVITSAADLPAGATVTRVNGQLVNTVEQAANALYAASELMGSAVVTVSTPSGPQHLYVTAPPPSAKH
jgi:hypothetical protein